MNNNMRENIKKVYLTMLEREPTVAELDFWKSEVLQKGQSLETVENAIKNSDEWKWLRKELEVELEITEIYYKILKRAPDASGLTFWKSEVLQKGQSLETVENAIKNSDEGRRSKLSEI